MVPSRSAWPGGIVVPLLIIAISVCIMACARPITPERSYTVAIERVLVVPFRDMSQRYEIGSSVRCPICGSVFATGSVLAGADDYMTRQMIAFLKSKTDYALIPPEMAEGERSKMLSDNLSLSERGFLVEMGKRLEADAVISGRIYRFRQRIGTSFGVDTPASVSFGIHFIRVADGSMLWLGRFDETQHSLSENLFKMSRFIKRGGTWLTAEELAVFGLHEVMASLPDG